MEILGVILARAGSKGLPGKCLRPVLGRAMIEYTFDHALAAERLTGRVLTTDCRQAGELARKRGIEVVDRPAALATDTAPVDAACRHAVRSWETQHNRRADVVAVLYGNIPARAPGVIDRAVDRLITTGADSVRTVAPVGKHHPDWCHRLDGDRMVPYRSNSIHRRQDLSALYFHDGAVVVVTREVLMTAEHADDPHAFFGHDRRAIVQRSQDSADVDTLADLHYAEALLQAAEPTPAATNPAPCASSGAMPTSAWACLSGPNTMQTAESRTVMIADRPVGPRLRTFIVAEAGVNHNGSTDAAIRLVDLAADCGADAVKFQVFRAAELTTADAPAADYQRRACGTSDQQSMLKRLELEDGALRAIRERCQQRAIAWIATPFSVSDVHRLTGLDVAAIKIASTDLPNTPLIRAAVESGKPVIVSTGASTASEIDACVQSIHDAGAADRLILLHCVSCYPTPIESANLRRIRSLARRYGCPCGYSDHTTSTRTGAWAVSAGACMLEKHVTLDRAAPGPDHAMSLDAEAFAEYVASVRSIETALGDGTLGVDPIETEVRSLARRSVVLRRDLPAGTVLTEAALTVKRPAGGIEPADMDALVGRRLRADARADTRLTWDMLA